MRVTLLVDPETIVPQDPEFTGAHEPLYTELEFHIAETLRELGHEVFVVSMSEDLAGSITKIRINRPDLIFNITEHFAGIRRMDMHIAAILDMLEIPYTGAGPDGLMLCRDKGMCKRVLSHHKFKVPQFATVPRNKKKPSRKLRFPVIVKPELEDGSEGISLASLVHNEDDLVERIAYIHRHLNGPAICEEFIEGRELYVGIIGNDRLQVLPPREIRFDAPKDGGPRIATSKVKQDEEYRKKWNIAYTFADLSEAEEKRIARTSKRIYRLLKLRDYGRIDLRITAEGDICFLEANPNPDLSAGDEVAESAEKAGISYSELIDRIIKLTMRRSKPPS